MKAAVSIRLLACRAPRRRSTARNMLRTGWSTSSTKCVPMKVAVSGRLLACRAPRRLSTVRNMLCTGWSTSVSKRCVHEGCSKHPSFGVSGTKKAEYCAQHAPHGMVNIVSKNVCP